jgi:hypothetical protein
MSRLSEKLRYGSLGALLVLALIAGAMPGESDHGVAAPASARAQAPAPRPAVEAGAPAGPTRLDIDALHRDGLERQKGDPFLRKSWYVAPPPAPPPPVVYVAPPEPPPPSAPPLPFSYMGRLLEEPSQHPVYFLVRGDKLYTVAAGDLIEGTYRLEGVESGQLALTYLPLNVRQLMPMGSGS